MVKSDYKIESCERNYIFMYLNEKFSDIFVGSTADERVRRKVFPKRVVMTQGNVKGTDVLFNTHRDQVTLFSGAPCTLANGADGENAAVLLDFGMEIHGTVKLMVNGVDGEGGRVNVIVRTGESVSEAMTPLGTKNTTNDHATRDRVMNIGFISQHETNESGFRFAYVELIDKNSALHLMAIDAIAVYRDLEYKGTFECDDARVNKIWDTAAYTAHVNMQNFLWDGIKRDRLVWIGDMHTEVMTILSVFGEHDIVPKSLDVARDETPKGQWMNGISSYSLWWLLIQYEWYMYTGNYAYLSQQKEYIKYLINILFNNVDENGIEKMGEMRFLDWPNSGNEEAIHAGLQGMLKMTFEAAEKLLDIFGETELKNKCLNMAAKMAKHVPTCGGSKPAAGLLALSGVGDAVKLDKELLSVNGGNGYSTFFGYYILAAKAMAGNVSGAITDMKQYWGGMLDMGATTFWEDFNLDWMKNAARIDEIVPEGKIDIHGDYGAYCYIKFRHSLCHGWSSGPVPFLSRKVLGVESVAPGFKKVKLNPDLGTLNYAKGTVPTPYGNIEVFNRKLSDGTVKLDYSVPAEIEVEE